ncbi:alpha/beta fold hydrolase [Roseivirga sp. UBA1976]|uniref:alpha/beta fold hydrolase n=1 Tax=Roseivirga sp. UBA1976 TaxID=1947386 RepID=UPI0025795C17|nr:alpha/beta fold hydrolase [Roseivirga sp. UBA1976]MEC7755949.1 alpha/beta fold hydrolase [Bacteroidota bacterium]|tara:strand:- start:6283 stop:7044 length:762 start_codon:yes stop_codon:yes gene_type:complete
MSTLNHKILGEGEPLVILHGLFGSLDNWMTLGKKWAEYQKVILVDQRNHGNSFHHNEFSYGVMAQDLKQLLNELNITKCTLLGHSMGGKTAMEFAVAFPEMIERLIVADIGPKSYPVHHTTIIKAFYSVPLKNLSSRNEADELLKEQIPDFGTRQFLLKNLARSKEGFSWKMNLDIIAKNIEEVGKGLNQNARFEKPTLFIRGSKSDYVLNDDLNLIHSIFTNSKVETIEGAGHWLHAEKPTEFFEIVNAFLD